MFTEERVVSVLRVYNNPLAVNSLRNLSNTSAAISKTLERLSSGLRINRASDDAAGLSISEKLRSQIRGLNRASMNALDGISLIQTAEGALNEVHGILQRMRELSVQAANGIYTANDRQAIQLEVSQLVDEIDRISGTTEFNTKKLLDGTLQALVSTDDYTKVKAAVVGDVGKGGNFVVRANLLDKGALQTQKTDVFATTQSKDAVGQLNYLRTLRADATITTAGTDGVGNTGVYQAEVRNFAGNPVLDNPGTEATLYMDGAVMAQAGDNVLENFQNHQVTRGVDKLVFYTYDNTNGAMGHSIVLNNANTAAWNALAASIAQTFNQDGGAALFGGGTVQFLNLTGQMQIQLAAGATLVSAEFVDADRSGGEFYMEFTNSGASQYQSNVFVRRVNISFSNNSFATGNLPYTAAAGTATLTVGDIMTTGQFDLRFDVRHDWTSLLSGGRAVDKLKFTKYSGGNSLQEYSALWQDGPAAGNGTFLVSAVDELTIAVFEFNNGKYTSLVAGGMDQTAALSMARGGVILDRSGNATHITTSVFTGQAGTLLENIYLAVDGVLQAGETATFNTSTNNVLTADQLNTLASLNRFQEFGVFNGRNNVELTVYQRGTDRSVTINLYKSDTLEDMAGKISLAIWNPGTGGGMFTSDILAGNYAPDLVHVNTVGLAKGTVSITTPVPGAEIVFAGDESLLKALSLIEVNAAESPLYSLSAYNIETAAVAGTVRTSSNEAVGLIAGLTLYFDTTLGLKLDPASPLADANLSLASFAYAMATEKPLLSVTGGTDSFFVHVAPRGFSLQVGANQGQSISTTIAEMSALALGVEGLLVVDSGLAEESISIIDHAIAKVSAQRSRLGAVQNRLESTIRNLDVAAENLTSSESRIRDVDVALETVSMTRNQILLNAGIAALTQANQLPQTVLQLLR
jgi:flagellin